MNLTKLFETLAALQLPAAVETEIYMLGSAMAIPFDGIVLDLLAGAALAGTIYYYWDDIEYKWSEIKAAIIEFMGIDVGNEVIEGIEEGLDDAGEGDAEAGWDIFAGSWEVYEAYGEPTINWMDKYKFR